MRGATRRMSLACMLGRHKRGSVLCVDRRLYSECHHCGSDLIRKGRRWHVAAPHELPGDWKAQHSPRWGVPPSLFAAVAGFVLLGALLFLIQR